MKGEILHLHKYPILAVCGSVGATRPPTGFGFAVSMVLAACGLAVVGVNLFAGTRHPAQPLPRPALAFATPPNKGEQ